ncbi:HAD hydrolase-like protein [bacterium]|nr:HAD hydrolase-like protein [bacterium]
MKVFFDLDGTLTDPKEGIVKSINYVLDKFSLSAHEPSSLERFIGPPLVDIFRVLLDTDDSETLMRAAIWFRERYAAEGYLENYMYDGIPELLSSLQPNHSLFVATSKRQDIAANILAHFGLAQYFTAIYGCDVDLSKTDLLKQILYEHSFDPSDCIMIGDRMHDIDAAHANNIPAIAVLWGYGSHEELINADYIISAPSEVSSFV